MTSEQEPFGFWLGPEESLLFAPDGSGWSIYRWSAEQTSSVFARLGNGGPDGFVIRELLIGSPRGGVDAKSMRQVPIGRIESTVNAPANRAQLDAFIKHTTEPHVPLPDVFTDEGYHWSMYQPARPRAPRLALRGAHDSRKPEGFYEQVALRFAHLTTVSARPAEDLAEANKVPPTTVHGWVREARRRGLLAAGERGRRGGGA